MATQPFTGRSISRRGFVGGSLAAGLAALTLSACSSTSSSESGGSASGSNSVPFTSFLFGTASTEGWIKGIDKTFTSKTSIAVNEQAVPYANFLDQIVLKAKGGNVSGVAHIDEEWLSTLATAGVLKPTDSFFKADLYPKSVQNAGLYKETRYAIPWTQSGIGMVANKDILAKAGVSAKITTVDDFTAALRAIKKLDSSITPYAPSTNVQQLKDIIPWMWTFGSKIYDGKDVTLGDDGSLKAIDYWKSLLDEGLIGNNLIRNDARTLFAQGRAAIYDDAPQAISVIPGQSTDKTIGTKMAPMARPTAKPGDIPQALLWSQPLVSFDDDPSSRTFMTYLSTDLTALQPMFTKGGQPPTTTESMNADWFTSNTFINTFTKEIATTATKNPFWSFPTASKAQNAFNEQVEAALKGVVSAKAAMSAAKDALQSQL